MVAPGRSLPWRQRPGKCLRALPEHASGWRSARSSTGCMIPGLRYGRSSTNRGQSRGVGSRRSKTRMERPVDERHTTNKPQHWKCIVGFKPVRSSDISCCCCRQIRHEPWIQDVSPALRGGKALPAAGTATTGDRKFSGLTLVWCDRIRICRGFRTWCPSGTASPARPACSTRSGCQTSDSSLNRHP